MATPRKLLVDSHQPMHYHITSRCVRRAFLCGRDRFTGRNYEHRKRWLINRILALSGHFAVEVYAYAVMSNHFHLVVHYDPLEANRWSDEEVIRRWLAVCPVSGKSADVGAALRRAEIDHMRENPGVLEARRRKLGSLSCFMKFLKQPIARRANAEDECKGHFFEQRFHSSVLLDYNALLAAMAYVDLNPVRTSSHSGSYPGLFTSAYRRLTEHERTSRSSIRPIASGLLQQTSLPCSCRDYARRLDVLTKEYRTKPKKQHSAWFVRLKTIAKKQRAYGNSERLAEWLGERGFRSMEIALH